MILNLSFYISKIVLSFIEQTDPSVFCLHSLYSKHFKNLRHLSAIWKWSDVQRCILRPRSPNFSHLPSHYSAALTLAVLLSF